MKIGLKWSALMLGIFTLSGQVMAGKGQLDGAQNLQGLSDAVQQQSQNGNTYRYQKHLGDKSTYQYRHRYQNERLKAAGLSSSGQRRSGR